MQPTLGQAICDRQQAGLYAGQGAVSDVIVFHFHATRNRNTSACDQAAWEWVAVQDGIVSVNGQPLDELYRRPAGTDRPGKYRLTHCSCWAIAATIHRFA
jgi:hypothetical protein